MSLGAVDVGAVDVNRPLRVILARPLRVILARKSAHDIGVVFSSTVERFIDVVKIEREAAVLQ